MKSIVFSILIVLVCSCRTAPPPRLYWAVTIEDILKMTNDSVAAKDIVDEVRSSHTLYKLSDVDVINLKQSGVAPEVIEYIMESYHTVIRNNRKLEDTNYWWPGWDGYFYGGPAFGWPNNYWNMNWGPGTNFKTFFYWVPDTLK